MTNRAERIETLLSQLRTTWQLADNYSRTADQVQSVEVFTEMRARARAMRLEAERIKNQIIAEVAG